MLKRKSIFRVISMILGMTIVFSFSGVALASETSSIDEVLIDRGFPLAIVQALKDEVKENLYNYGDTFDSATLQFYNEDTKQSTSYEFTDGKTPIMPRGQIQTSNLSLTWLVTGNGSSKRVTFNYDWKTLPINRWQDPIGVSWDQNLYVLRGGSFHKVDRYIYYIGSSSTKYTGTQSDQWAFANATPSGVTWYADLKGHSSSIQVNGLYGYGQFILDPKGSANSYIYGRYVHQKLGASISMSVAALGNFSITGGSSFDELGSQQYVSK